MIAALTKYWKTDLTEWYYNRKMDAAATNRAIEVSGMPREIAERVFNIKIPKKGQNKVYF